MIPAVCLSASFRLCAVVKVRNSTTCMQNVMVMPDWSTIVDQPAWHRSFAQRKESFIIHPTIANDSREHALRRPQPAFRLQAMHDPFPLRSPAPLGLQKAFPSIRVRLSVQLRPKDIRGAAHPSESKSCVVCTARAIPGKGEAG